MPGAGDNEHYGDFNNNRKASENMEASTPPVSVER
jgi:hypothetical protein